jgi:hypothetical protein
MVCALPSLSPRTFKYRWPNLAQYLIAEDPALYPPDRKILLYSISEIQCMQASGAIPFGTSVEIRDLHVIGKGLKSWSLPME